MRRLIVGLVIAAVLVGGGAFAYFTFFAPADSEETVTTPETNINDIALDTGIGIVSAEGQIAPLQNANLAFLVGGQVAEILVLEGQMVTAGEPLIRLDSTNQALALQQAEAALTQAQANLETAEAGLGQAQTGLDAAQLNVTAAEAQLAVLTADLTSEQLALEESQVDIAEANISQASGSRAVVFEGPTEGQIRAAEAQVQAAEAALLAPRNRLDQVLRDTNDEDTIRQAQLEFNAAVANLTAAQARLDDLLAGATAAEQQAANAAVTAATASRDAAQANFDLVLAGPQAESVRVQEINVEQAQLAISSAELDVQQAEVQVANAQNSIAEAEAALAAAQSALDQTVLTAPFDGTIATVNFKEGQVINPGAVAIVMADFSQWQVETTDLTELNVVNIRRGLSVDVTIDAFPGETLSGTIEDIASVSDLVLGDVTYVVTVELDDTGDLPLRWGMTSFVSVDTDQ